MLSLLFVAVCLFYIVYTRNHIMANDKPNHPLFLGKSSPASADETVYSEVKPGAPLGNNKNKIIK